MRQILDVNHRLLLELILLTSAFMLMASVTNAQEPTSSASTKSEIADATKLTTGTAKTSDTASEKPIFADYKGIRIGMSADEVRQRLDHLKEKGERQDFFVFSDQESAQIFYDPEGKVTAISIDYIGANNNAPSPRVVLGEEMQARPDGSMYKLKRYPEAGYWVAYNRTAGEPPHITVTVTKIQ